MSVAIQKTSPIGTTIFHESREFHLKKKKERKKRKQRQCVCKKKGKKLGEFCFPS